MGCTGFIKKRKKETWFLICKVNVTALGDIFLIVLALFSLKMRKYPDIRRNLKEKGVIWAHSSDSCTFTMRDITTAPTVKEQTVPNVCT